MKQKYIPAFIMLAAGAVVSILDIINGVPKLDSLKRLLLVLVLFYIIGLIAKGIIGKAEAMKEKKEAEEQNPADESGQEGNKQEENGQEKNRQEAAKNEKAGAIGRK